MLTQPHTEVTTPALYRTTITHCRHTPVHHAFEYRSYSWYVDVDDLPRLPWWLRPFARFEARDHLQPPEAAGAEDTLRTRLDTFIVVPSKRVHRGSIHP